MRAVITVSLLLCVAAPAAAQRGTMRITRGETAPGEVAVAVTLNGPRDVNQPPDCETLNLPCSASGRTFLDAGWAILGSRNFTDHVAVTGEVGVFHNLWDSEASIHASHREDNLVHFALVGPRIASAFHEQRGRTPSEVRVFGQVLVGVAGGDVVIGGVALQPGAGADIRFSNGVMLRAQLDYCFVPAPGRSISGPRLLLGVVIGVGSRLW